MVLSKLIHMLNKPCQRTFRQVANLCKFGAICLYKFICLCMYVHMHFEILASDLREVVRVFCQRTTINVTVSKVGFHIRWKPFLSFVTISRFAAQSRRCIWTATSCKKAHRSSQRHSPSWRGILDYLIFWITVEQIDSTMAFFHNVTPVTIAQRSGLKFILKSPTFFDRVYSALFIWEIFPSRHFAFCVALRCWYLRLCIYIRKLH